MGAFPARAVGTETPPRAPNFTSAVWAGYATGPAAYPQPGGHDPHPARPFPLPKRVEDYTPKDNLPLVAGVTLGL